MLGRLPSYLIAPSVIATTTWDMLLSGELWRHTRDTLLRALARICTRRRLRHRMGLLAGIARPVERFYEPIISLTYPVPKIVVLPVLIAWLGAGDASKIAVITAAVFYPTFINSLYGAKAVNRLHVWSARNMGASAVQVLPQGDPAVGAAAGAGRTAHRAGARLHRGGRLGNAEFAQRAGPSHHHRRGQHALRSDVCGDRRHRRDRLLSATACSCTCAGACSWARCSARTAAMASASKRHRALVLGAAGARGLGAAVAHRSDLETADAEPGRDRGGLRRGGGERRSRVSRRHLARSGADRLWARDRRRGCSRRRDGRVRACSMRCSSRSSASAIRCRRSRSIRSSSSCSGSAACPR